MDTKLVAIPLEIRNYLESILQESHAATQNEEIHEEMIQELFGKLDNFIASVIAETMPEDKFDAFVKLNEEKKSQQEIEQYLRDNLPNAQQVMANAFVEFRNLYLNEAKKLPKA